MSCSYGVPVTQMFLNFDAKLKQQKRKIKIMKKKIYLLKQDVDSRPQRKLPSRANECVVLGTFSYMSHSSSAAI